MVNITAFISRQAPIRDCRPRARASSWAGTASAAVSARPRP